MRKLKNPEDYILSARKDHSLNDKLNIYSSGLENFPDNTKLLTATANTYIKLGFLSKSRRFIEMAQKLDSDDPVVRVVSANIYFLEKKYEQARLEYYKSLELDTENPNNPSILSRIGNSYFSEGRYNKAEEIYKEAVQKNPKNIPVKNNLTRFFMSQERCLEAVNQCIEALKLDDTDETALKYKERLMKICG